MTWFLDLVGSPPDVKAAIQKEMLISPSLRAALCDMCDDRYSSSSYLNGLRVRGNGHSGECSYIGTLEVERLHILPKSKPPVPEFEERD